MIELVRHFVSKKEGKLVREMVSKYGIAIPADGIEVDERRDEKCYFINGKPAVYVGETVIPTLFLINEAHPSRNNVTVDDGAVPHIVNGSDVFAQGITSIDPGIGQGDLVFVRNLKGQYIAVGTAKRSSSDIAADKKGQAITLLHYPGDSIMKKFYS